MTCREIADRNESNSGRCALPAVVAVVATAIRTREKVFMLPALLLLPICTALLQVPPATSTIAREALSAADSSIVIVRAVPGGTALIAGQTTRADYLVCKRMAQLAVQAFYGKHSAWDGPLAYMQRAILSQDVHDDVHNRLRYYEEARARDLRHRGAVFTALDASSGDIIGFADIGLTVYDSRRRTFRLPKRPEGEAGFGTMARSHLQCRPYLSNLAVDASQRRRGVGRLLVDACEAEVRRWRACDRGGVGCDEKSLLLDDDLSDGELGGDSRSRKSSSGGGVTSSSSSVGGGGTSPYESVWLEVSTDNDDALGFYRTMGYEVAGETSGKEIVRRRFSFESEMKTRWMMRKPSEAAGAGAQREGA